MFYISLDKALELDLELAEARRKVIEAELGMTSLGQDKAMTSSTDLDDFQQASPGTSQNHFDKPMTPEEGMHTLGSARPRGFAAATPPFMQDWAYALKTFTEGMQLPPCEIKKFAGDPLKLPSISHRFR